MVVIAPWSGPDGQRVDVVAGGGTSTAASGPARSLRLPGINAMAVAKDGTVWAAGATDVPQIIRIDRDGRATRTAVHPTDNDPIQSMAVAPDGILWILSGNGGDTAYRFVHGTLEPAFAPFAAKYSDPPDGSLVTTRSPQPDMTQFAFDGAGRLVFLSPGSGVNDFRCVTLRRIAANGRITTLAGRDYTDRADAEPNSAPANGTDARHICLAFSDDFAMLGLDRAIIRSEQATFIVDLRTGRTSSLSSVSDNSPTTPAIADRPSARTAAMGTLYMGEPDTPISQLCATSASTWFAVNPRTTKSPFGSQASVRFPATYDWRPEHGKLIDIRPGHGLSQVLLRVDGTRAQLASGIASTVACTAHDVYVSAATETSNQGTIVRLPVQ
ncbi:hypothetical protein [uncultured Jatrophihabitans sp.]|uniref:hypothetical protein n=1 Tax=uncultured Jatrophihabitans sp. TaxID=1610747 RepID=UPI0035CC61BD